MILASCDIEYVLAFAVVTGFVAGLIIGLIQAIASR